MARTQNRLTAKQVASLKTPGRHADGGGLYLHIKPNGWRGWCFITVTAGKRREIGLGRYPETGLADARAAAAKIRSAVAEGGDPKAAKASATGSGVPNFSDAAEAFISGNEDGWRNPKHRQQWRNTIASYCQPIANKPVDKITANDVLACVSPIWSTKNETASRVRGRIERVLDFAAVKGWRDRGANPAAWKGNLQLVLPGRGKVGAATHHGAMPYADVPAFYADLVERRGVAALALRFAILTAARSGEVRGLVWSEIDTDAGVWTVPADRMKAGREHRVPLTAPALAILNDMAKLSDDPDALVFPGTKPGRPLSDMSLTACLRRMKRDGITVHGFRSSFSTWCAETTTTPHEVREAALAHAPADKVSAAYQRGDLFAKRRELMKAWASLCTDK